MKQTPLKTVILALTSLLAAQAQAGLPSVEDWLREFRANPRQTMSMPLPRVDAHGNPVSPLPKFPEDHLVDGRFVADRDTQRSRMCMERGDQRLCLRSAEGPLSEILGNDRPEDLIDADLVARSLRELERRGLRQGRVAENPWSDDYWPFYRGTLGARYDDPDFPASGDWGENRSYIRNNPAWDVVAGGNKARIDLLSPAEKYDLLVGDPSWTLTNAMWEQGRPYYENTGNVEAWMGICEGWAPASYQLARPLQRVTVPSADGRHSLNFYPADIKALASLLWARGIAPYRFIGGRCNDSRPATDQNGRTISQQCFDTNPGAWHLAVTHQIGISRRSFVLDATYDYEVWNQPVVGYQYSYFNPQTGRSVPSLEAARVSRDAFTEDRFAAHRSWSTASVVGIAMDVTYVEETSPMQMPTDSPENDALRTVRYIYDLELDSQGSIVGGEWYTRLHPDFLWTPARGTRAISNFENEAWERWQPGRPVPSSWSYAAPLSASYSQPLAGIVEGLIARSRASQ